MAIAVVGSAFAENVAGDSLVINLKSVEVSANRAGKRTPIAFTNMSGSEIKAANDGRDIPFIVQSTPSVVVTGDAGGGIGYSAIRVRGTDPSRINITANGIPINDPESSSVYFVDMPDFASSVRDMQIQRGVGTSTNGAGAFGASINMITDAPALDPEADVSVSYGSYNSNRQTVKVNSGLFADRWSVNARISHIGSDGYIDRAFSKLWSYMAQVAYLGRLSTLRLLAFGGKEQTYMAWDYATKEEMEKYGRRYNPCGKYTASNGETAFFPDQTDNFVQHHLQLLGTHAFTPNLRLNAALHYTKGDGYYTQYKTKRTLVEYGLQPFVNAEGETVKKSDLIRLKNNDNDFGGATATLSYSTPKLNATLGSAANWHRGRRFGQVAWVRNYIGPIDPMQEYYNNIGRKFDANIYGRADLNITDNLSTYADMQLRHVNYSIRGANDSYDWATNQPARLDILRRYTFFNPKAGIAYANGAHRVYASVSVAHKEPVRTNFTDADTLHYPNPERLIDWEAGWSYASKLYSVSAGVYYMDYKDQLVVTGELSDSGNALSVNVPKSYRAGIELQGSLRPAEWFDWQINATLSRNRIKNFTEVVYNDDYANPIEFNRGNTPIAFSPDVIANNAFNFHHADFTASLSTRYVSSQYLNNTGSRDTMLDAYCVTDLSASYTFRTIKGVKALRIGATVYNIFNAKYCNNGYSGAGYYLGKDGEPVIYRYAGYAAQAPINFMTTASLTF